MDVISPDIYFDPATATGFLPNKELKVTVQGMSKSTAKADILTPSDAPIEKDYNASTKVAWWGDDNNFPAKLIAEWEKNPTLANALNVRIDRIIAGGIEWGREFITPDGEKVFKYEPDPEINNFLRSFQTKNYFIHAANDFVRFGNFFPEIIFTNDKSKVASINRQSAPDCRWAKQNPTTGFVDKCYINKNWALSRREDSTDTITNWTIDPYVDTIETIAAETNILKYIFKPQLPTHRTYYDLVTWWTAKTSGWLDHSNLIPIAKNAKIKRGHHLNKHIEINQLYLEAKYGEKWIKGTPDQKNTCIMAELKHFNEMFQGEEKTGGTLVTPIFYRNEDYSTPINAWEIHDLTTQDTSAEYLKSSEEADAKIHYAVGVDMTTTNTKSGGGRNGSDKQEAFNIDMLTNFRYFEALVDVIYWALEYNGKNPNGDLIIRPKTPILQTQAALSPDKRKPTMPNA